MIEIWKTQNPCSRGTRISIPLKLKSVFRHIDAFRSLPQVQEHCIAEIERLVLYLFKRTELIPGRAFAGEYGEPIVKYWNTKYNGGLLHTTGIDRIYIGVEDGKVTTEIYRRISSDESDYVICGDIGSEEVLGNLAVIFQL